MIAPEPLRRAILAARLFDVPLRLVLDDPTPMDHCEVCGQTTETPPLCASCDERQADEDAAKAYREGRYE